MDGEPLTVTEIVPRTGFYDYDAKYGRAAPPRPPARIPPHAAEAAMRIARLAHASLGCRGVTRADLRYDDIKTFWSS